jgi:glycerol-3-phosphate dehydrogenase (NAD(P)+)
MSMQHIFVLGAGAWGTALALVAQQAGRMVTLWAREPAAIAAMAVAGENRRYLPGIALPPDLRLSADLADAARADAVLLAAPAQHLRPMVRALVPHLRPDVPLVLCAKGIEIATGAFLHEMLAQEAPAHPVAALSGPTFASEVARGLPTAVALACEHEQLGWALVHALGTRTFRPYWQADLVGAEVGGAVKNVLAIACGIAMGLGLGENARAALVTRGLAELARLGAALGARPDTLMGLSGLGDVVLTCNSPQSRNMSLGIALGQGWSLAETLAQRHSVAEGVPTAQAVMAVAARLGVELPICGAVHAILHTGADLQLALQALLERPFRAEAG